MTESRQPVVPVTSRMPSAFLERRSAAFARATCGKGLPVTWGVGKDVRPGFEPRPAPKRKRVRS